MNLSRFERNICRICLGEDVSLDWNTTLYQFYDTTYKDCYYKYSQLECYAPDPFPQMLCQKCSSALQSTHALILKALESHKLLQDEFSFKDQLEEELKTSSSDRDGDIDIIPPQYETAFVEKLEIERVEDDNFKFDENSDEEIIVASKVSTTPGQQTIAKAKTAQSYRTKNKTEEALKNSLSSTLEMNASPKKAKIKPTSWIKREETSEDTERKLIIEKQISEEDQSVECEPIENVLIDCDEIKQETETSNVMPIAKKKYRERDEPRMCFICSKILRNKYSVQMHEQTHTENRERKETCKICGLKFFDKRNLYCHMRIHKENRQKHKCEFCSKAFYDKANLNIHRRIHLGQMVPCSLCNKEFFRQIDLERHMSTHSATTINLDAKKKPRYFVRCEHCDKSIQSIRFKAHIAAHLNEPLMKCSICDKEYFHRKSCVLHLRKVHQKTKEEYSDFIVVYKKDRISHLFLEQNADMQVNND